MDSVPARAHGSPRPAFLTRAGPRRILTVTRAALDGWWRDDVPRMGAALAYYTLFSLAPILIVVVAIGGLIFGPEAVQGQIVGQIDGLVGHQGAEAVQSLLKSANRDSAGVLTTIVGVVTFLLGATGAFLELQGDLDRIFRVQRPPLGGLFKDLILQRIISFGLVMAFAFLLITALVVSAALTALNTLIGNAFLGAQVVLRVVDILVSIGVLTVLFAMIYRVLPDIRLAWSDVWVGGLATALLFTIGKTLIGLYIGASSTASSYGAAGSVVVLLVWVYYSAQIVLLGAEFTRAWAGAGAGRRVGG